MKPVRAEGYDLITCPCCGAWPIRDIWLRRCEGCGEDRCRVNLPDEETLCAACRGEEMQGVAGESPASADTLNRAEGEAQETYSHTEG